MKIESTLAPDLDAATLPPNPQAVLSMAPARPLRTTLQALEVAPFALLRMATVPYRALDALRLPATEALIVTVFRAEAVMESHRALLETMLFDLVARLGEHEVILRRSVLKLRRQIHAAPAGVLRGTELDAVAARLDGVGQRTLAAWRAAQLQLQQATCQAELSFVNELQTVLRPALRAPLANCLFRTALALASAGVAQSAQREQRLPTKPDPDNFERSLFGYLVRAAAKTSPFSSFMALSAIPVEIRQAAPLPVVRDNAMQRRVRLNRGMVARLSRAMTLAAAAHGKVALILNPTLAHLGEHRYRALCERDVVVMGRPWREQRRAHFKLHPTVGSALMSLPPMPATYAAWRAHLTGPGVEPAKGDALVDKLIERGVLKLPQHADAFDMLPETALLRFLRHADCPELAVPGALMADLSALSQQLAADGTDGRSKTVEQIGRLEQQIIGSLRMPTQASLQNVVLEDCWTNGVEGRLGSNLLSPLAELHDFLSTQVEIAPQYLRLVDYFVQEYGNGASCDDLPAFLLKYGDKLIDQPEYGNSASQQFSRVAPAGARMGVTAHVDIAYDDSGQPLMIVNKVYDRPGWLAARFAFGDESRQEFLRSALRSWLKQVSAPSEPVDFLVNGECNDLQAHPRLTDRVLQWHGEPVMNADDTVLPPESLRLRHNPVTQLLELFDQAGKAINLVYLGSTFPTPSWGIPYAVSILTQPFRLMRPDFVPPVSSCEDIVFKPRLQHGQLVLSRAVWWVRSEYLMREWFAESGAACLLQVRRDVTRLGMPTLLFAQAATLDAVPGAVPLDALSGDRKPLWIDIRVPFCLSMLKRIASRHRWVALTEMLPEPKDHWLEVNDERHVCELQVELIVNVIG